MPNAHAGHADLVRRLSKHSVEKHYDAYEDVAWDRPEHRIEAEDPRWAFSKEDALGGTEWYQAQPAHIQSALGLDCIAHQMGMGMIFEGVLSRGLLEFAGTLNARAPELRYALHEVVEESQHSLMFREFVERTGSELTALALHEKFGADQVPRYGRRFPELFFLFVLGGEVPIDGVQKRALERRQDLHPLLRRIMQIHVTEEARHLSFARSYLREHVPKLGFVRRMRLRFATPLILAAMTRDMLDLPARLVRKYRIPREAQKALRGPHGQRERLEVLEPLRDFCVELGIATERTLPVWRRLGLSK